MLVYGVLYLEVDDGRFLREGEGKGRTVFEGVRRWWGEQVGRGLSGSNVGESTAGGSPADAVAQQKG